MRGPAGGGEPHAKRAARGRAQPQIGRLAIDQKPALRRDAVGGLGAVAAAFFAADEYQADARLTFGSQPLRGGDLRGENALGVTRAAPIQHTAVDAAREERRHTIEVRREHEFRFADGGDHVRSRLAGDGLEWLFEYRITALAQEAGQPGRDLTFIAGRRFDVDELASEREMI